MVRIQLNDWSVEKLSGSSGLHAGTNLILGRKSSSSSTEGFGAVTGNHNETAGGLHTVKPSPASGKEKKDG
ncbi:hypothetical protein MJA45_20390 [Paenibacillus aurantius]|uniref:Uncharacterized protein n=1 Tax=Paenibacillus aurantius TaxID=2918900 RepID=A0AA96LE40_9BACL|nr:hypothetical protein [Paenibacillus aurantius]WJH34749.1 hypothetical protein N6H14_00605 [Paenibacillus sp. CC-CFT747]WNQ09962.1 hypothetical protein MJA45_20390 [Paenibacillus aurantius]